MLMKQAGATAGTTMRLLKVQREKDVQHGQGPQRAEQGRVVEEVCGENEGQCLQHKSQVANPILRNYQILQEKVL